MEKNEFFKLMEAFERNDEVNFHLTCSEYFGEPEDDGESEATFWNRIGKLYDYIGTGVLNAPQAPIEEFQFEFIESYLGHSVNYPKTK